MLIDMATPPFKFDPTKSPEDMPYSRRFEKAQYMKALDKLEGKDAVGRSGELLVSAGGAAAGAAAAGTIASAAGATTLLSSTTLAGALGGVFVAATPVGWIIGTAAVGGMVAFGIAKMIRSGTRQDEVRANLKVSIKRKVAEIDSATKPQAVQKDLLQQLELKLAEAVKKGALPDETSRRILFSVTNNELSVDMALDRISRVLAAGVNS